MGTNQADPVYTVSMACPSQSSREKGQPLTTQIGNHPQRRNGLGLNHGFLGETVFITFGL